MGKRSKNRDATHIINEDDNLKTASEDNLNKIDKLQKRKKNKNKSTSFGENDNSLDRCKKKKRVDREVSMDYIGASEKGNVTEKAEENISDCSESLSKGTETSANSPDILTKLNNKNFEGKLHIKKKTKKIKFEEDGKAQVNASKETDHTNDNKSYLNAPEHEIQDEDIDQFCNEIDDEDNKQYENWISLLEQKLGSNDNTSSNKKKKKKNKNK